ncbi:MAG TPA: hypothetical protein VGH48_15105 [Caldimonas sp.]|jgi:hypothetical protein
MTGDDIAPITSRSEFVDAIRVAFALAAQDGAREILIVDPNFADWPLNDHAVVDSLTAWVDSRRSLTLFADSFDEIARRQSRFVEWRRQWAHVVRCRTDPELEAEQVPTILLAAGATCVRLVDRVRYRGTVSSRPIDMTECREAIDALLQRSAEAFPVTTLGL